MKSLSKVYNFLLVLSAIWFFSGCGQKFSGPNIVGVVTNSAGMVFNGIPAGSFEMGSANGEAPEQPVHKVTITKVYFIGRYEVTYGEWSKVYNWALSKGYDFGNNGSAGYATKDKPERNPVVNISWFDAVKWCNALSEMEGKEPVYYTDEKFTKVYKNGNVNITPKNVKWSASGYRLPTEAEWEYACRATSTNTYFWGNNSGSFTSYTWNKQNSMNATHEVGKKSPNNWQLYDICGNVWEWCWDYFGAYSEGEVSDPIGPASGANRIIRGGGWNSLVEDFRVSVRVETEPNFSYNNMGFRVVFGAQ